MKTLQSTSNPNPQFEELSPWKTISESGRKVVEMVRRVAPIPLPVYLSGETGTGKEVLAKWIHQLSPQKTGAFIPINCGALPSGLVESELFGHIKGSFTGALRDRPGALLQSHMGTLFLDEVGDLTLDIQVKLLRFLEEGEIRPVGSDRILHSKVRVISATHKPLDQLVREGRFRQDLYYRLAAFTLPLPSLRNRPEDIRLLAAKFAKGSGFGLTPEAMEYLVGFNWPGNVRELKSVMTRAMGFHRGDHPVLDANDFHFLQDEVQFGDSPTDGPLEDLTLAWAQRRAILRALRVTGGNRTEAAKRLKIARSTLFEMMKRFSIVPSQFVTKPVFEEIHSQSLNEMSFPS